MRRFLAGLLLVAGMAVASAGLAGLLGVIAAAAFDGSGSNMSFHIYDLTINGRQIPDAFVEALLVALPVGVMLVGTGLVALGWYVWGSGRAPRNMVAHRS